MYSIEALVIRVDPSITYPPSDMIDNEWVTVCDIPQLESEQAELQEARAVNTEARKYYTCTRITKSLPGGERVIVI